VKYHEGSLDFPCRYANRPVEVPARADAVREALGDALKKRRDADV